MITPSRRGHQGEYLDANPLERAPDGEVKARWRDEGEWLLGSNASNHVSMIYIYIIYIDMIVELYRYDCRVI